MGSSRVLCRTWPRPAKTSLPQPSSVLGSLRSPLSLRQKVASTNPCLTTSQKLAKSKGVGVAGDTKPLVSSTSRLNFGIYKWGLLHLCYFFGRRCEGVSKVFCVFSFLFYHYLYIDDVKNMILLIGVSDKYYGPKEVWRINCHNLLKLLHAYLATLQCTFGPLYLSLMPWERSSAPTLGCLVHRESSKTAKCQKWISMLPSNA